MELLSTALSSKWRRSWRRNRYERLNGEGLKRRNMKVIRFGGDKKGSPPRRVWKLKAAKKLKILKLVCYSPLNFVRKIKNAYIDMMMNLGGNDSFFGNKRIPKARQAPVAAYSNEEFDARMVYEIYKALKATQ